MMMYVSFQLTRCSNLMKNNSGFTLIEVLIAAIILFTALALISDIYKSASLSASKAVSNAKYYQITPAAITAIKTSLREKVKAKDIPEVQGEILIFEITYFWQATRVVFNSAPTEEFADFEQQNRFSIYDVKVTAKFEGKERLFLFKVATW